MTTNELYISMMTALTTYTENPTESNRTAFLEAEQAYITARANEMLGM